MKNSEKFTTAKERAEAFQRFLKFDLDVMVAPIVSEAFRWLDLEAPAEETAPCPFCGEPTSIVSGPNGHAIICDCGFRSQIIVSRDACICEYNRVARAAAKEKEANDANA